MSRMRGKVNSLYWSRAYKRCDIKVNGLGKSVNRMEQILEKIAVKMELEIDDLNEQD